MYDWTRMLRPAGGGIYVVSTGRAEQQSLQRELYGADSPATIERRWREMLGRVSEAAVLILGVPLDVGAGFRRGASFGPGAIRRTLLRNTESLYRDRRVVDVGDVLVVPQLLHDDMLSEVQLRASREALYGDGRAPLPASPLSMTERALRELRALAPEASLLVLGGDHSLGFAAYAATCAEREGPVGILHFDAHTDLLPSRLGVKYCFATWAYHANELLGRRGLFQVGIRTSQNPREHWERALGVRQIWADEARARSAADLAEEAVGFFEGAGASGIYISNDIDGTDPRYAAATGTPEPAGLEPELVEALIRAVGQRLPVWGSDLVEVAPPLGQATESEPVTTLRTAARYVEAQLDVSLRSSSLGSLNPKGSAE